MLKTQVVHVAECKNAGTITSFRRMLLFKSIKPTQSTDFSADMSIPFRKDLHYEVPWSNITFNKFHAISYCTFLLELFHNQMEPHHMYRLLLIFMSDMHCY